MKHPKSAFLLIFIIIPLMAHAHGPEIFYTLFINTIEIVIFAIALLFLRINVRQKAIMSFWFFLAFISSFIYASLISDNDSKHVINAISPFLLFAVAIITYVIVVSKTSEI